MLKDSIHYAPSNTPGTEQKIERVTAPNHSTGKQREIPHVTLAQLVDEKQRDILERKESLFKGWKQYYFAQTATYLLSTATFMMNYINDDNVVTFKKYPHVQMVISKINAGGPATCTVTACAALVASAAVPLIQYLKPFYKLNQINFYYPHEIVEDAIAIFRKKTFSHTKVSGNTVTHYYNLSEPIGYMTIEEKEKELEPIHQAARYMNLSLLNATLCGAALIWAISRYS